jgi:hypothetical protein
LASGRSSSAAGVWRLPSAAENIVAPGGNCNFIPSISLRRSTGGDSGDGGLSSGGGGGGGDGEVGGGGHALDEPENSSGGSKDGSSESAPIGSPLSSK